MAKIKHIALSTQDVDKTAAFYVNVFGMKEIARIDSPNARGYYLSDGDLNLAILNFKNDAVAGVERGKEWSGIHHIGFQVESLEAIAEKLAAVGSEPRHDINEALGGSLRRPHVDPARGLRRGGRRGPRLRAIVEALRGEVVHHRRPDQTVQVDRLGSPLPGELDVHDLVILRLDPDLHLAVRPARVRRSPTSCQLTFAKKASMYLPRSAGL